MLTQIYYSPDDLYTLEYPRTWDLEMYEHIPAFFDPMSGNGALQVLAVDLHPSVIDQYQKETLIKAYPYLSGEKLLDKMVIFLHMQEAVVEINSLKIYMHNDINFIPYEYVIQGRFYMTVLMEKNNIILLAVYNSANAPDKVDATIIGDMIKSIKIRSKED